MKGLASAMGGLVIRLDTIHRRTAVKVKRTQGAVRSDYILVISIEVRAHYARHQEEGWPSPITRVRLA